MKKVVCLLLALVMLLGLVACTNSTAPATEKTETTTTEETKTEETKTEEAAPAEETEASTEETGNVHIGIVTGSVSQSEDDRRGAEAFQAEYCEDMVKLAIYLHRRPGGHRQYRGCLRRHPHRRPRRNLLDVDHRLLRHGHHLCRGYPGPEDPYR